MLRSVFESKNRADVATSGFHHCTHCISFPGSVPHLLRGEILVSSREKFCHEGLYGPHHGEETVDEEQHSGAHPISTAGHKIACPARPVAALPAPAKTHRSSPVPGDVSLCPARAQCNLGCLIC